MVKYILNLGLGLEKFTLDFISRRKAQFRYFVLYLIDIPYFEKRYHIVKSKLAKILYVCIR